MAAFVIVVFTFGLSLYYSASKKLWSDEVIELLSDSKTSFARIIYDQAHYPFSLDPPASHLFLHALLSLAPHHTVLLMRLPSMLGLAVIQLALCVFTWRLLRHGGAAVVATALPACLVTIDYSSEARVYSLFAMCFALALIAYQAALLLSGRRRIAALLGLFISLGTGMLLHYYGIFLPVPMLAGELYRWRRKDRVDKPMMAVLLGVYLVMILNLPYIAAGHVVQTHYFKGQAKWSEIIWTFLFFVIHFGIYQTNLVERLLAFPLTALAIVAIPWFAVRRWRCTPRDSSHTAMLVALIVAFLLPFPYVALAHLVTHGYSPRYGLPSVVAVAVLLPLIALPLLQKRVVAATLVICVLLIATVYVHHHVAMLRVEAATSDRELKLSPEVQAEIASTPDHHLYVQDAARLLVEYYYASPAERSILVGLRSVDRELYWVDRNVSGTFTGNMDRTTPLRIIPWETLRSEPGAHLVVVYEDPAEEWIDHEIASGSVRATLVGAALGGKLYRVTF
jgi:hypothetical protein